MQLQEEKKQNICLAYSAVLREWIEALSTLGTSKHLPAVVLQLWFAYLQRVGVAVLPEDEWARSFTSPKREESVHRSSLSPSQKLEKGTLSKVMLRKTQKGKTEFQYRGFSYSLSKSENGKESWCCEKVKSCPGCLLLLNWEIVSSVEHNHPPMNDDEPLLNRKADDGASDTTKCISSHQLGKNELTALTSSDTVCCYGIEPPSITREIKKEEMSDTSSSTNSSKSRILRPRKADVNNISLDSQKSPMLETKEHEQDEGRSSDEDVSSTSGSDEEYTPHTKRNTRWYYRPRKSAGYNMHLHKCIKREPKDDVGLQSEKARVHWQPLLNDDYLWHSEGRKRIPGKEYDRHEQEEKNDSEEKSFDIKEEETPWPEYSREAHCGLKRGDGKFEDECLRKIERKKVHCNMTRNNTVINEGSQEEMDREVREMSWENDNEADNSSSWEENSENCKDGLVWEKANLQEKRIDEKKDLRHKFKKMSRRLKSKVSYDTSQQKTCTPKKWCQSRRFSSLFSIKSFPSMMKILLGLLYLAVLLAKEHILLMDMLRWCQEGLIPYLSSAFIMKSALKSSTINVEMTRGLPHIPDSACVRKIAGELSIFLSLQSVPHPPIENVVAHLANLLRLPEQTTAMAQEMVSVYEKERKKDVLTVELPCVESQAMAALVLTLKMWCGIDDLREHQLSTVATRINAELGSSHSVAPLFSWDDWKRYITRLLWFCEQVDPLCGLIYSTSEIAGSAENRFLSGLSQILTFCKCAPTVHMTDMKKYTFVSNMMDAKGLSMEKLFDCPRMVRASSNPFLGIVEQFIAQQTENEKPRSPELLKMGHDLQQTSFASHQLFWPYSITNIQQDLKKCGSEIILHPVKYPKGRHLKVPSTPIKKRKNYSNDRESLVKESHYYLKNRGCLPSDCSSQSFDTENWCDDIAYVDTDLFSNSTSSSYSEHVRGTRDGMYCNSTTSSWDSADLEDDLCAKMDTSLSSTHCPGDSTASESDTVDKIFNNGFSSGSNHLFVPLPLYRVWRLNVKKSNKNDFWKTLPHDYRWLITVGSLLCSISKQQLIHDVNALEHSLVLNQNKC
ncbi:uncharacterized protein [Panulirus ornatus]|uniref:uncharacterized protein isoform X2 n=1 Tax=Panulirus ornatus TaxID=150431 RepID=UPI003A856456